jgi:Tfp pilus assembly protein FimV
MTPDVLTFSCPHCGVLLTIPSSMAGVAGPCPQCRATIEAPKPAPSAPAPSAPAPSAPAPAPAPSAPAPAPTPQPAYKQAPRTAADISQSSPPSENRQPRTVPPVALTRPKHAFRPLRLIFPLLFLFLGAGLVFGLLYHLGNRQPEDAKPPAPARTSYVNPGTSGSTARKILNDETATPATSAPSARPPPPITR